MAMLLHLTLWVAIFIQVTSSQSTYDVIEQQNDVSSCRHTEQVPSQLVEAVLQITTANSQLLTAVSQMQRDIAELKAAGQQTAEAGIPTSKWKSNTSLNNRSV